MNGVRCPRCGTPYDEAALENLLIERRQFSANGARRCAKSFVETMELMHVESCVPIAKAGFPEIYDEIRGLRA